MSPVIAALTVALLLLAPAFPVIGVVVGAPSLGLVGGLLGVLYVATWLVARPAGFALQPTALWLVFPLWRHPIGWEGVVGAQRVPDARALREALGVPFRVGVGGLWGVFGWVWTTRRGWVVTLTSRADGGVLVEREGAAPLLLSPDDPQAFVEAVRARLGDG